jgi:hypothetical protein
MTASATEQKLIASANERKTMRRVIVDHFGGPEVLRVVEDDVPQPGLREVRVRVLAAGVSFTDSQLRAGTYLGVPKPPFTPGYELVGVVEKLGPGCSRLMAGDRIGALTVWGADAERVCVPEANAVEVPEDLDPAEVVSLVFTYMTAYQLLHRKAKVKRGESMLVHGAAGRVGTAVLELGAVAGLRMYGTCAAQDRGHGRAARCGGDRLPERGLLGAGAWAPRQGRGRRARWDGRQDFAALLPRAAARRTARCVRPLRHTRPWAQEPASVDRVVRGDRDRRALGPALSPPAGVRLSDPEAARGPPDCSRGESPTASRGRRSPQPGMVPAGLPRAPRAAP